MKLEQRADDWWIVPIECGPYETRGEAEDDLRGLKRFFKCKDDPVFILGEGDARIWREKMENELRELARVTELTIRELQDKTAKAGDCGVQLMSVLGLLRESLKCLDGAVQHDGIKAAKRACEELANQARRAYSYGDDKFGDFLVGQIQRLSFPVAQLLPYVKPEQEEQADAA